MKVGTKVKFRFAGSWCSGEYKGPSKSGKHLINGDDGYIYPIELKELKKIK